MSHELVVTAVGPDRPGIASDFTGHVHAVESPKDRLRAAASSLRLTFEVDLAPA